MKITAIYQPDKAVNVDYITFNEMINKIYPSSKIGLKDERIKG